MRELDGKHKEVPADMTRNIKMILEYDGTRYHGWQRQANGLTVQEVLEEGISTITQEDIRVIGSGRTDAGVHAIRSGGKLQNEFKYRGREVFFKE